MKKLNKLFFLLLIGTSIIMTNSTIAKKTPGIIKVKGMKFIKSFAGIDEYQLDNGLKVLLKPNKNTALFSSQVWYKVGSRNEAPNYTGIAHYLEHIMFKGTETFAKGEIAQSIQLRGGIFNAFTGDDYTAYYENFSPENLELAIKIESDRMQSSRLDADEIDLERSVIISELEGNRNNPNSILYENLRATAFKVHSYRNPVIGWREDLDNINAKVMREFYETYYYPNNAVAIIVGNFDKKLALELIGKYYSKYKAKDKNLPKVAIEPEQNAEKKLVLRNGGHTKLLGMAFHVPEFNHTDSPALGLISDIVFSGMSSRLYPKLVDAGLATSVSGVAESSIDPSIFRIMVSLNPEADIEAVEEIILAELEAIKTKITEEELTLAKAKEEASFVYQTDGPHEEAMQIGYFEAISNDWTRYATWLDDIKKVTAKDIQEAAKKYFKPSNKTVVHLLPETTSESLIGSSEELPKKVEANYGAGVVEPLNPKKLERLLKITKAKYSKKHKFESVDLEFQNVEIAGGTLYFRKDMNIPLVYLNAYFYAGSCNDDGKYGIAKLTNDMLSRGSESQDKYELSKLTDLYGADVSFATGREMTRVHLSTIRDNLDKVVDLLDEILKKPAFSEVELERLKENTVARLKQEDDYPQRIAAREISRIVYPKDHPYYILSVEDRIKSIESVTLEEIKAFYKKHYNANNLFVSIVGSLDLETAMQVKTKLFDSWNTEAASKGGNKKPEIPIAAIKDPVEKTIVKADKTQTEIILAHAGALNRTHPDYYALLVANYALGGSALSSRLGTAVRDEHGYVYNIRSGFDASLGAGSYKVSLGCNPKNVEDAIKLTKKVIADYLKEGMNETELKVTKSYLTGSFAARTLASNDDIADTFSQMQVYELGADYIKTYEARINAITLEQVREAARKYIHPEKLSTVIVGP